MSTSARKEPRQEQHDRVSSAGLSTVLETANASGLLGQGLVNIISVDVIRTKLAERWERRADDVWNYIQRCCDRLLNPGDIVRRINETEVLVVVFAGDPSAAQGICFKVLEEVLTFFLGSAQLTDLTVRTVTALEGDFLLCSPADPSRAIAPRPKRTTPDAPSDPFSDLTPLAFVGLGGRVVRVEFDLVPFISVQSSALAAMRLTSTIHFEGGLKPLTDDEIANLSSADILRIDQRAIECVTRILDAKRRTDQAIILPMSFRSATMLKARMALASLAAIPEYAFPSRGLVELYDLGRGAPPGRVTEVIGLLRTFCRGVILHLPCPPGPTAHFKGCGHHGVAISAAELGKEPRLVAARLLEAGASLKGAGAMRAALNLPQALFIGIAEMGGFTHATINRPAVSVDVDTAVDGLHPVPASPAATG